MNRFLLLLALTTAPGCFYKVGSGLMAGILDETGGKGRSGGIDPVVGGLVEKALLEELGQQLGGSLRAGAVDLTPSEEQHLHDVVDRLITVAMLRAGKGMRTEVGPELRNVIKRDIVEAFAEGLRGEIGPTLEATVDGVVTAAVTSLRRNLDDEQTKFITANFLRDAVYSALREGYTSPAIGESLEDTLRHNVLSPLNDNVTDMANNIAFQVDAQAQRGERTLRNVINLLLFAMIILGVIYLIQRRQLRRERLAQHLAEEERAMRQSASPEPATHTPVTRALVEAKLREIQALLNTLEDDA